MAQQRRQLFSLVPRQGRGLFTSWSRFSMGDFSDSFSGWRDVVIRDNAWQQTRTTLGLTLATAAGLGTGPVWALYYFNAIDTATASATPRSVLLAHVGGTVNPIGGTAVLGRYDTNVPILSTTTPHQLCFLTIKNRCHVAGISLAPGYVPTIVTKYPTATSYPWGKAGPTAVLSYRPYSGFATGTIFQLHIYYNGGGGGAGISNTGGVVNWTSPDSAFSFPGPPVWDGKTLVVNGVEYKINAVTAVNALSTLTAPAAAITNAAYEVHYGQLSWTDAPPMYTYSYYNPATGHSTNAAPVLTLSEQDMTDVSVELRGIPITNDPNYTHIIIFRSEIGAASGIADMRPLKLDTSTNGTGHGGTAVVEYSSPSNAIGLIRNSSVLSSVTYVDNQPNDQLGAVIGDAFAPPDDNDPPSADIRYMEYWDGRVWYTTVSEPWRLRYSRDANPNVLGVAEESFPARLVLDIPSTDGLITGIRSVGGGLLVGTDRYLYSVEGVPYRLVKTSSRGVGVNHFAIDEHPGDTTLGASSAIYISKDRRLWRQFAGGRLVDLGAPIQNRLDLAPFSGAGPVHKPYIVRVFQVLKHWLCAVGILDATQTSYNFYFFDFDAEVWMDLGFLKGTRDILSFTSGTNYEVGAVGTAHLGSTSGQQIFPFEDDSLAVSSASKLTTQFLDMGASDVKKSLEEIVFYVDDVLAAGWACGVRFDGTSGGFTTLVESTGTGSPRYRGPGVLRLGIKDVGVKQWHSIQLEMPLGTADAANNRGKLYRVDLWYNIETPGEAGKPSS